MRPKEQEHFALERGRTCFDRREWHDAFEALVLANQASPLGADDLYRLAWSAGLTARDDEMLAAYERLFHARFDAGELLPAARAAFWLGFRLLARGEGARANGWLSRAQRIADGHGEACVEQGYLLLPAAQRHLNLGELKAACDAAERATRIGERFGETDLVAFGRNLHGRALLRLGDIDRGLALMDEAMVDAIAGALSPVVTGLVYCSGIASCHRVYALDRVREWTLALAGWVDAHPQLVMFAGPCLAHRAEIMGLGGAWPEAVEEAGRAIAFCVREPERGAAGAAHYQQAEIHRLRGEWDLAEAAYRNASRMGVDPQPGLALLRLALGDTEAAASAIRRVNGATSDPLQRARYLPACVEILLAAGDLEGARAASEELRTAASTFSTAVLAAIAKHACAAVRLAAGDAAGALDPARRAFEGWQQLGAPYLAARLRVLIARACAALGDADGATLELANARECFQHLGALPDLAAADALAADLGNPATANTTGRLTGRELQVLRLVAAGKTNKAIARELDLSEKTVDRHVSNIFAKIDVPTRAAATAYAYEHKLV